MLTRKQHELLCFIDQRLRETGVSPSFEEMKEALDLRSKSGIHRLISALEERGFLRRHHHRARALEVLRLPEAISARSSAPTASPRAAPPSPPAGPQGAGAPGAGTPAQAPSFTPHVIQGDFRSSLPAVRAANDAVAVQLPLYGRIAAGLPIEALADESETVDVPAALLANGDHFALTVSGDSMIEAGIHDGDTVIIRRSDTAENGQIVVALIDESEVTLKRLRRRGNSVALEPANPRFETRLLPAERVRVQGRLVALLRRY